MPDRDELIRFVARARRSASCPISGDKLPGRGVWVTARSRHRGRKRSSSSLFSRASRPTVRLPENWRPTSRRLLRGGSAPGLSLANKAGSCHRLRTRSRRAIADKPVVALSMPRTRPTDGRRKLANQLRKTLRRGDIDFPVIHELSIDELDLALGRSHVIHAALVAGAASDGFLNALASLPLLSLEHRRRSNWRLGIETGRTHDSETPQELRRND